MAVFTVVTLLATALLAVTIGNVDSRSTHTYRAVFSDAANVGSGDEVRMAGVRVGSVSGVSLYRGTLAEVTFSVDRAVSVTTSTTAVIRYRNLIGQRYLALVDGAGDGRPLRPGSVIPLARTQPALNLTTLFNGFRPLLAGLSPGDVNQLSFELIRTLQGEGGTITSLFGRIGSLTGSLADRDAVIGEVIGNLNAVLGPLDAHDQQLSSLIGNLQRFISGLSQDREAIGRSLVGINGLAGSTQSLLREARPALKTDIAQLGVLAEKLDGPQSRALLMKFLTYTPFKLRVATPEASYGAFLNFYVCGVNFILPDGTETPMQINTAKRCHP
jgi:phospholipid/cholesterol/gamma-HCH transport system substrate-binding protein